jgi:outer membrane lipoprotein carrier protein
MKTAHAQPRATLATPLRRASRRGRPALAVLAALALTANAAAAADGAKPAAPPADAAATARAKAAPPAAGKATAAAKGRTAAVPASTPQGLAVARDIAAFYAKVEGVSADFTQVVRKRGIKKGLKRSGKMWIQKGKTLAERDSDGAAKVEPGKMRWDYPAEEIFYFSDGDLLWTYERRERVAIKLPVRESRLYQATGYLVGQGDLAEDFALSVVPSPVKDTIALEMVPKDGTAVMQKLTLVVDKRTSAVVASILVDPLGDSTSLFFANLRYGALDATIFAWTPPVGVTVRTL